MIKKTIKKHLFNISAAFGAFVLVIAALLSSYLITYKGRVYPNISIANVKLAGLSQQDAEALLAGSLIIPKDISLIYQDQQFSISPSDIEASYDATLSATQAYNLPRTGNVFYDIETRVLLLVRPVNMGIATNINKDKLDSIVSVISGQISTDEVSPSAKIVDGKIIVDKGTAGKEVDSKKLASAVLQSLYYNLSDPIQIPIEIIDNTLTDNEAEMFAARAEKYIGKSLTLKFEYSSISLKTDEIFKIINPKGGYNKEVLTSKIDDVAKKVERQPQNPKFVFSDGKVTEFQPALEGIKVDRSSLETLIVDSLDKLSDSESSVLEIDIPVDKTPPEITTDKVNNLGIKELVGRGTSTYFHSIPSRVHNVALAASRINGTLVKPGETFSFNQVLGDVSAFTGYQQAYIISEGKTILGDGGGVCQVSSTLFRAVLNAGLPILERQAHAYRVGYYEQGSSPGFDATVYSPSPDFKFKNDTDNYILIEAIADTKNYSLIFELYGTKDGRIVSISKPVVTNVTAPPPDVYQDDPTLPTGTIKQVDYKAWGAKVTFKYIVTKGGQEIINKTFISNYKPWAAVYLRGTGPAN